MRHTVEDEESIIPVVVDGTFSQLQHVAAMKHFYII